MGASVRPDPLDAALADIRKQSSPPDDPMDAALSDIRAAKNKPGVVSRAASDLKNGLVQAVTHPIDTAEQMIVAPVKAAFTAAVAPGVGEARPDPRLSKGGNASGRAIDRSAYDAEHGGVTSRERTQAGLQAIANAATPAMFSGIKSRLGTSAALAATGAANGAASNPNDPGVGAIAGGVGTLATGTALRGVTKAANTAIDLTSKARRVRAAEPLGAQVVEQNAADTKANIENYGRAADEGDVNGGTSPALAKALEHRHAQPFVDLVRDGSDATLDDATTARKVIKLMSKEQRGLKDYMTRNGYDAAKDMRAQQIGSALKRIKDASAAVSEKPAVTLDVAPETFETAPRVTSGHEAAAGPVTDKNLSEYTDAPNPSLSQGLRNFSGDRANAVEGPGGPQFQLRAQPDKVTPGVRIETPAMRVQTAPAEEVPPVMPSLPHAVSERAKMAQNRNAFNTGADATRRIMRGSSVAAKKLDTQSPEAFLRDVLQMNPEQAQRALDGALGRAQEETPALSLNPKTGFGVGRSAVRLNRISPFLDALDKQAGNPTRTAMSVEDILKYLGVADSPFANPQ